MTETFQVRATNTKGRTALWDRDKSQPGGEVFITGDGRVHEVAETSAVLRALADKRIVRVGDDSSSVSVAEEGATDVEVFYFLPIGIYTIEDGPAQLFHDVDDIPDNAMVEGFESLEELRYAVMELLSAPSDTHADGEPSDPDAADSEPPVADAGKDAEPSADATGDEEAAADGEPSEDEVSEETGEGEPAADGEPKRSSRSRKPRTPATPVPNAEATPL